MNEEERLIRFVAKVRKSGIKRVINVPSEKFKELDDDIEYYEVYLIPIKLNKLKKE